MIGKLIFLIIFLAFGARKGNGVDSRKGGGREREGEGEKGRERERKGVELVGGKFVCFVDVFVLLFFWVITSI